jgi:tRNA (guanine37-N1)-methyltransferase
MLVTKTPLREAQKVKQVIIKNNLLNSEYLLEKDSKFIYFPLNIKKTQISAIKKKIKTTIINKSLKKKTQPPTLQELLKNKFTKKELSLIPSSQERVGSILILEIPRELIKKETHLAKAFLETVQGIITVVKKEHFHEGTYRLRKVRVLAGKKTKETTHTESGIKLKLDLEKTYFSARSANERLRISKLIKPNEEILIMFSGAAPYPLVLAKNSSVKKIWGIEINPLAHQYALNNVKLNKLESKIIIQNGDVRELLPKIKKKFDRIIMPLPKTAEEFLDVALKKAKPNTIIHLYAFLNETDISKEAKVIKEICNQNKHKVRVLRKVKCGQFSPNIFRVCFDLKILN